MSGTHFLDLRVQVNMTSKDISSEKGESKQWMKVVGKSLDFTCYSMLCYIRAIIRTPSPSVTVIKLRANSRTVAQRTLIIWAPSPRLCFRYSVVSNPYDQFNDQCLSLEIVLSWKCLYFIAISLLLASQMEFGQATVWILFYPINLPLS